MTLPTSPLANPYRIGPDGDRAGVCEAYLTRTLNKAMEQRRGPLWDYLLGLAQRLAQGERLTLACWCAPEQCHAVDIAEAVRAISQEVSGE
jgi:hypothetical protein